MIHSSPRSIEIGVITAFSGEIVNIPAGWFLCDGTNGTPDLRNKFIVGAGPIFSVDDSPVIAPHDHDFTGDGHSHEIKASPPPEISAFAAHGNFAVLEPAIGTTDVFAQAPPYYALAYIQYQGV